MGVGVQMPFFAPYAFPNGNSRLMWTPGVGGRLSNSIGRKANFWELTGGFSMFNNSPVFGECQVLELYSGYRMQNPSGGFFLRAGTGLYNVISHPGRFVYPSLSFSLGYTIPNGRPGNYSKLRTKIRESSHPYKGFALSFSTGMGVAKLFQGPPPHSRLPLTILTSHPRPFLSLGVGFKREVAKDLAWKMDINYLRMGLDYQLFRQNFGANGEEYITNLDLTYQVQMLSIPVYLGLTLNRDHNLQLLVGPQLNVVLGHDKQGTYTRSNQAQPISAWRFRLQNHHFGVNAGLSWEIPVGSQELDLQFITGLSSDFSFTGPNARTGWMQLKMCYLLPLVTPKSHL